MRIFDISVLGWLHTLVCLVALPTGFAVLAMTKGTARHKRIGHWYLISMALGSATALGLTAPIPGFARFNVFHWLSLATLVLLGLAYMAARRQAKAPWAYLHPLGMALSYYMLIGALINELFVRAPFLQRFKGTPALGITHGTAMMVFIAVLAYFAAKVAMRRARGGRAGGEVTGASRTT